jgi:hypothetical protein
LCGGGESVSGSTVFVDDLVGDFPDGLDPVDLADTLAGSENVFPRFCSPCTSEKSIRAVVSACR